MIRLMVTNRLRDIYVTFIAVAAVNTLLNLLVIPVYGPVGAAAVRVFTEALNFFMLIYCVVRSEKTAAPGSAAPKDGRTGPGEAR
jgi:O-antigen/teichoic acid export membrane protein